MDINNKRIVITGATSGIGLELLTALAKFPGTKLIAVGRKIENVPQETNILPYQCDVSIPEQVDGLFLFAIEQWGGIDIFVGNAGFAYYEKLEKSSWSHIQNIFSTNVISPIYSLTKMIEINNNQEFMVIITDSVIGRLPFPGYSLYTGTKFALDGFNTAMQYEMPKNGHLCMIYPVATYTKFFDRAADKDSDMPWPHQQTPTVVKAVIKGILNNKKRVFPFPAIKPILYLSNLFPFILPIYLKGRQRRLNFWYNNQK